MIDLNGSLVATGTAAGPVRALAAEVALRAVLQSALTAVVSMDESGAITAWNETAERIFGWAAQEAVGRLVVDLLVPPRYRDAHTRGLGRFRRTGEGPVPGRVLKWSALHRDGREFPVELTISPAATVECRTTFVAVVLDVTERQEESARLTVMCEDARRAQESLTSMIVHELRSPLAVIAGYASMLKDGVPDAWQHHVRAIVDKADTLRHLVDDLLLGSRIEAGHEAPQLARIDVRGIVADAVNRALPAAELAGAEIVSEVPGDPIIVAGDKVHLRHIVDNLVANALAYGRPHGRVIVSVIVEPTEDAVQVVVADDGMGIALDMRERIFDRFVRGSEHSGPHGTGLGLFICRQLAEAQGGRVVLLWSELGQGSRFALWLPAVEGGSGEEAPVRAPRLKTTAAEPTPFLGQAVSVPEQRRSKAAPA